MVGMFVLFVMGCWLDRLVVWQHKEVNGDVISYSVFNYCCGMQSKTEKSLCSRRWTSSLFNQWSVTLLVASDASESLGLIFTSTLPDSFTCFQSPFKSQIYIKVAFIAQLSRRKPAWDCKMLLLMAVIVVISNWRGFILSLFASTCYMKTWATVNLVFNLLMGKASCWNLVTIVRLYSSAWQLVCRW